MNGREEKLYRPRNEDYHVGKSNQLGRMGSVSYWAAANENFQWKNENLLVWIFGTLNPVIAQKSLDTILQNQ